MKSLLIISAAAFLLTACAAPQLNQSQLDSADYGSPMSAAACTSLAETHIKGTLKDPFSAQFVHGQPCYRGAMKQSLLKGGAWLFGYLQEGTVNAKNSYGGYVGFRQYKALMRGNMVVNYCIIDPADGICM